MCIKLSKGFWQLKEKETRQQKDTILVKWQPPPAFLYKLSTHSSVDMNLEEVGGGSLIRDLNGHWIRDFTRNLGRTTAGWFAASYRSRNQEACD